MTANSAKQLAKLGQYLQKFCKTTDFNRVMAKAVPVACTKNTCTVELAIDTEHANTYGTLHGGLTASLVDTMTTMALVANDSPPGVSVELSVSYMRPAAVGSTLLIHSEIVKLGKSMAFLTSEFRDKESGKLIATGKHIKHL
uniref:Acyl-coenzyme A thioesterase 13 n=1 Tax=Macrostomum lignano TaxID=282301 RepID=A0A1I8IGS7_9PLAT